MAKRGHGKRRLTQKQLRSKYSAVRTDLKKLRRLGLVSQRANLDKARPSLALRRKAESFQALLSGEQQLVRVPRSKAKEFESIGYRNTSRGLLVPVHLGEKAQYRAAGYRRGRYVPEQGLVIVPPIDSPQNGLVRIILPIDLNTYAAFDEWIDNPERLERLKPQGSGIFFGFTFMGNRSLGTGDAQWVRDELRHYTFLQEHAEDEDFQANVEIWAFDQHEVHWGHEGPGYSYTMYKYKRKSTATGQRGSSVARTNAERQREYKERLKANPKAYRQFRFEDAARKKDYRQRIKNASTINQDRGT